MLHPISVSSAGVWRYVITKSLRIVRLHLGEKRSSALPVHIFVRSFYTRFASHAQFIQVVVRTEKEIRYVIK